MNFRDRLYELLSVEEVDQFLERYPTAAFFKAGSCHKTMQGFGYVEKALNQRPELHTGFVRVIESRPVSNYIAEITGVVHQSPQFILIKEGEVVYDVDNWNIVPEALEAALTLHLGNPVDAQAAAGKAVSDLAVYKRLLQDFIQGALPQQDFTNQWLKTFQMDAAMRSTEEFALLNSLFGDVDAALMERQSLPQALEAKEQEANPVKLRARVLMRQLEAFEARH